MENETSCIRVYADQRQIHRCAEQLKQVEPSFVRLAQVLGLAGNEVRLKILYLLQEENELCVCDLSDILAMSIPAISQHLRKLKDAQLVQSRKVAQTVFYSLQAESLPMLQPLLNQVEFIKVETV